MSKLSANQNYCQQLLDELQVEDLCRPRSSLDAKTYAHFSDISFSSYCILFACRSVVFFFLFSSLSF